jgi:hypothetical protein
MVIVEISRVQHVGRAVRRSDDVARQLKRQKVTESHVVRNFRTSRKTRITRPTRQALTLRTVAAAAMPRTPDGLE